FATGGIPQNGSRAGRGVHLLRSSKRPHANYRRHALEGGAPGYIIPGRVGQTSVQYSLRPVCFSRTKCVPCVEAKSLVRRRISRQTRHIGPSTHLSGVCALNKSLCVT